MNIHNFEIALKNQYVFEKMFVNNEGEILLSLQPLFKEYDTPPRIVYPLKQLMNKRNDKVLTGILDERKKRFRESLLLIKSWSAKERDEFMGEIREILTHADLGEEWWLTIAVTVLQGWFFPPMDNFYMRSAGDIPKKRVVLELNPDTSIEDIKEAWATIKNRQKKLWPNFRRINLTTKSFTNLAVYMKDLEERFLKSTRKDTVELEDYTTTDIDRVGAIWPNAKDVSEKADRKRATKLRQIRHRLSKKA
jgi:hypothetical protein